MFLSPSLIMESAIKHDILTEGRKTKVCLTGGGGRADPCFPDHGAVPEPTVLRPLEWSWPVCRALLVTHGFVVRAASPQDCHALTYPQTRGPRHPRRVGPPDPRCPESLLPARSHKPPAGAHRPWYLPQAPPLVCHVAPYVATCTQDLLPPALHHGVHVCAGNGRDILDGPTGFHTSRS